MSALDLLSTDSQFGEAAPYVPTGFTDVLTTGMVSTSYGMPNAMPRYERSQAYEDREKLITDRFGEEAIEQARTKTREENPFLDPVGIAKSYADPDYYSKQFNKNLDSIVEQGRAADAERWQGIKTSNEIDEEVKATSRAAIDTAGEITSKAPTFERIAGTLLGGFGGAMTDPINIATLPFGAGASRSMLQAIGIDAVINAGIEAYQQPEVMRWQKELGYKYGIGDAIANVATAGAGAGIISGLARGTGPAVRAVGEAIRLKSMPILERMAFSTALPSQVRDAAAYMSRVAHVDEEIPLGLKEAIEALRPPAREDGRQAPPVRDYDVVAANRQNLQETQEAFRNYREPVLTEPSKANYTLAKSTPEQLGLGSAKDGRVVYEVLNNGKSVGFVDIDEIKNGIARIGDIVINGTQDKAANSVGIKAMRGLLKQIQELEPEIKGFAGERVSGARFGGSRVFEGKGVEAQTTVPPKQFTQKVAAAKKTTKTIRERKEKPLSLLEFIAKRGGIEDPGADLKAMGADNWHKEKPFRKKLVRQADGKTRTIAGSKSEIGYTPDDVALAAWEAGYFPGLASRPSVNDLLDAIDGELRGSKKYKITDNPAYEPVRKMDNDEMLYHYRSYADELGIKLTDDATLDEVTALVAAKEAEQAADFEAEVIADNLDSAINKQLEEAFPEDDIPFFDGETRNENQQGAAQADKGIENQIRPDTGSTEETGKSGAGAGSGIKTEGEGQQVIPGAERITDAELAQRGADQALQAKVAQKGMTGETNLFDLSATKQNDLFSNTPETTLAVRPNDALRSMESDVLAADASNIDVAFNADFARLLAEQPDLKVQTEAGELTIREIADSIKEGENILSAIKTCAVGKK